MESILYSIVQHIINKKDLKSKNKKKIDNLNLAKEITNKNKIILIIRKKCA